MTPTEFKNTPNHHYNGDFLELGTERRGSRVTLCWEGRIESDGQERKRYSPWTYPSSEICAR
jgi:hypothetical protein